MSIVRKIHKEIKDGKVAMKLLPEDKKKWSLFYFLDLLFCEVKYGTHPEDYISLWFWDKSAKERKPYLTSGNRKKFSMKFYTKEAFDLLGDKKRFNIRFADYLKRDWICTDEASEQEIRDFILSHGRVIVKPLSSSCGEGIEVIKCDDIQYFISKIGGG